MSLEYSCVHFENGVCKKDSEPGYVSHCVMGPCHMEEQSVGDRVRCMTDIEIAKLFTQAVSNGCPPQMDWDCQKEKDGWDACDKCWCKWLQQPYKEDKL